ncbi:MAG: enoyl-CoA hydratase, partial [Myxococcales bacterium]|nr:enoyl-CoA hydratase [Myxococcales bacterium]
LADRIVAPGTARAEAEGLAREIARFPQLCLRSDRLSAYEQWDRPPAAALENELRRGLEVIESGETREGATRFAQGAGRGGSFSD